MCGNREIFKNMNKQIFQFQPFQHNARQTKQIKTKIIKLFK